MVVELDSAVAPLSSPAPGDNRGVAVDADAHIVAFRDLPMAVTSGERGEGLSLVFDCAAGLDNDIVGVQQAVDASQAGLLPTA